MRGTIDAPRPERDLNYCGEVLRLYSQNPGFTYDLWPDFQYERETNSKVHWASTQWGLWPGKRK